MKTQLATTPIRVEAQGIVFRNPKPHLRAVHAWHPRLMRGAGSELFVTFDIGEAVESLDYRTFICRSDDDGETWSQPVRLYDDNLLPAADCTTTHFARPTMMRDGTVVALIGRYFREHPDEGIINHRTTGLTRMDLHLARSNDRGVTWQSCEPIELPFENACFEVAHPIIELRDGRWLAPLMTWRDWNGQTPHGEKAMAFISDDHGKTWPHAITVMDGFSEGITYFEQGLTQLADGRILATAWAFDHRHGNTRSVDWAVCERDDFTLPQRTPLCGETAKLIALPDGRALCVYRGIEPPGLCASILETDGVTLTATDPIVLWQGESSHMRGKKSAGEELAKLKLGSPNMTVLQDGSYLIVFWCCVDCVFHIRSLRINVV